METLGREKIPCLSDLVPPGRCEKPYFVDTGERPVVAQQWLIQPALSEIGSYAIENCLQAIIILLHVGSTAWKAHLAAGRRRIVLPHWPSSSPGRLVNTPTLANPLRGEGLLFPRRRRAHVIFFSGLVTRLGLRMGRPSSRRQTLQERAAEAVR